MRNAIVCKSCGEDVDEDMIAGAGTCPYCGGRLSGK